jgi:hypothetical protein
MSTYSYQDLNTRLKQVEDKLDWLLNQFKVQKMTQSAIAGPDGRPSIRVDQQTLAEVYRDIKNGTIELVKDQTNVSA